MKPLNTETQIKNAPKGVHSIKGANGLYLKKETGATGGGAYFVRYQLGPKRPTMGLGPVNVVSLDSAREAAKAAVTLARGASTRSSSATARRPRISQPRLSSNRLRPFALSTRRR